jgi:hypothetical protein
MALTKDSACCRRATAFRTPAGRVTAVDQVCRRPEQLPPLGALSCPPHAGGVGLLEKAPAEVRPGLSWVQRGPGGQSRSDYSRFGLRASVALAILAVPAASGNILRQKCFERLRPYRLSLCVRGSAGRSPESPLGRPGRPILAACVRVPGLPDNAPFGSGSKTAGGLAHTRSGKCRREFQHQAGRRPLRDRHRWHAADLSRLGQFGTTGRDPAQGCTAAFRDHDTRPVDGQGDSDQASIEHLMRAPSR